MKTPTNRNAIIVFGFTLLARVERRIEFSIGFLDRRAPVYGRYYGFFASAGIMWAAYFLPSLVW